MQVGLRLLQVTRLLARTRLVVFFQAHRPRRSPSTPAGVPKTPGGTTRVYRPVSQGFSVPGAPGHPEGFQKLSVTFSYVPFLPPQLNGRECNYFHLTVHRRRGRQLTVFTCFGAPVSHVITREWGPSHKRELFRCFRRSSQRPEEVSPLLSLSETLSHVAPHRVAP